MSACTHPTSALYIDKQRGVTHCTLCGDVVVDQQYELDPIFARGTTGGGGGASGGGGGGGARSFRPSRMVAGGGGGVASMLGGGGGAALAQRRPSIDAARRGMLAIARELQLGDDTVEMALGIYKLALSVNAVSGARSAVLCACLYAVCRREKLPYVIYDFAAVHGDEPHAIMSSMKQLCDVTHTDVPVIDISCLLYRFAQQLDLGERMGDVIVCAMKTVRAMNDDWITYGRQPMGVCAAALLVACYVFRIPRTPEQVCGMVRLTAHTIVRRLSEFAATPAAALASIDDYTATATTLPPAFGPSSRLSTEDDVNASMRELSALYYELVAEAKVSAPATPARCDKWRRFIARHCELENITPTEDNLDLTRLSAEVQLRILGLPHTRPIAPDAAEQSVKREESKLLVKRESTVTPTTTAASATAASHALYSKDAVSSNANAPIDFNDPQQLRSMTEQLTSLLNRNAEVHGLYMDFDLAEKQQQQQQQQPQQQLSSSSSLPRPTQNAFAATGVSQRDDGDGRAHSPPPHNDNDNNTLLSATLDDDSMRVLVEELLRDGDRRHALPWQFVVLQTSAYEDVTDLLPYLVLDNEERLRREKVGQMLYKEQWQRGRARATDDSSGGGNSMSLQLGSAADGSRSGGGGGVAAGQRKRRRHLITQATSVPSALERALRGRGAATVHTSHIRELLPGLVTEDMHDGDDDADEDALHEDDWGE